MHTLLCSSYERSSESRLIYLIISYPLNVSGRYKHRKQGAMMYVMHLIRNQYAMSRHHFYDSKGLNLDKGHVALNRYTEVASKITIARTLESTHDTIVTV